ncbi:50S ribosomal protein L11 methyltransferase [Streptomyces sp. ISL-36]|nr:50S ribosomal protein L11 methyltransferase [Streptomyces sp. ISL-36]
MRGYEWDLLDEVFAPIHSPSTETALDFLGISSPGAAAPGPDSPVRPSGGFLEIGCGAGVISVLAAFAGCAPVVAADISPQAVRNTELNAARHDVTGRVRVVHSDLFSALGPQDRYDTVFWSSNYVLAPAGYRYGNDHERAYVDPGYTAHRRYLAEAPGRLTPGGRALLHFSSRGNLPRLRALAEECGRELRQLRSAVVAEGDGPVEHLLLEIRETPSSAT